MTRDQVHARIREIGVIPAVRLATADDARFAAEAICEAGIPIVELTMTVPGAIEVIASMAHHYPDLVVGAGTVLDLDTAQRCLGAGARFLTSPGLDPDIVDLAHKENVVIFPGVLTPSEVHTAVRAGCDFVKVFPCAQLGGPGYIRVLKAPFPKVPMIAAGGVNQQNASDYIRAGVAAIGVGADLIPQKAIALREAAWIKELGRRFTSIIKQARSLSE